MSDVQTVEKPAKKASGTGRRVGYVVAVIINTALLYLVYDAPWSRAMRQLLLARGLARSQRP